MHSQGIDIDQLAVEAMRLATEVVTAARSCGLDLQKGGTLQRALRDLAGPQLFAATGDSAIDLIEETVSGEIEAEFLDLVLEPVVVRACGDVEDYEWIEWPLYTSRGEELLRLQQKLGTLKDRRATVIAWHDSQTALARLRRA